MTEKRLSADELRAVQVAREKKDADDLAEQHKKMMEERTRQADAAQAAFVLQVKNSWYPLTVEAAKNNGVRFVVVAKIISFAGIPKYLSDVIGEIQQANFMVSLVDLQPPPQMRGAGASRQRASMAFGPESTQAHEVVHGAVKGWHPGDVPQTGDSGTVQFLIVRW